MQTSYDYGYTWEPRVNRTRHERDGQESGFRTYHDISAMFGSDGDLHVLWTEVPWPIEPWPDDFAPEYGTTGARIRHWSEASDSSVTVYDALWQQPVCNGGYLMLNLRSVSIAECRGRMYAVFTQFNNPAEGIWDDCADSTSRAFPRGAANGDLFVTVSADDGLTWDVPRGLTNTHSPGCTGADSAGGPCAAEVWPSMPVYGTDAAYPGEPITDIIVPPGGTDPGWYLDVQYIHDYSPGFREFYEGSWYQSTAVHWFRMACVDPLFYPALTMQPDSLAYPQWVPHCTESDVPAVVHNVGAGEASYTAVVEEISGPTGWLSVINETGTVGPGQMDTLHVRLNTDGVICAPGEVHWLTGRVRLESNDPGSPHVIEINVPVTDTLFPPEVDTLSTACVSLAVSNDGSLGEQGAGSVNLDFVSSGDCDPAAGVYLFDASPVVGFVDGSDTVVNWSVYGTNFLSPNGFVQLDHGNLSETGWSGHAADFMSSDSSVHLTQKMFAPDHPDTCRFMIRELAVSAAAVADSLVLSLADLIDWDIPSDTGARNGSDTLDELGMICQYGAEYHQDDSAACRDNDRRFGGFLPLGIYSRGSDLALLADRPYAAATRDNATFVFGNALGLDPVETYAAMHDSGVVLYESAAPESAFVDLHTLLTHVSDYTLYPGDTLVVYSALVVVDDGDRQALADLANSATDFFCRRILPDPPGCGCCRTRGDANGSGAVNISDLSYLVDFLFRGGLEPPCPEEGNVNASTGAGNQTNVSDLSYLIDFLFRGGAEPPPC
jgi:hypothetical protein